MHLRTRSQAEVLHLAKEIVRLGVPAAEGADGVASVKFGVLFNDDDVGNYFEALNGTLRAAKRLKIVDFEVRARARAPTRRVRAATYRPLAGALARAPLTRPNAPTFPTLCPPLANACRARVCLALQGQMLLQGAHDDVDVVLLKHPSEEDVASLA